MPPPPHDLAIHAAGTPPSPHDLAIRAAGTPPQRADLAPPAARMSPRRANLAPPAARTSPCRAAIAPPTTVARFFSHPRQISLFKKAWMDTIDAMAAVSILSINETL